MERMNANEGKKERKMVRKENEGVEKTKMIMNENEGIVETKIFQNENEGMEETKMFQNENEEICVTHLFVFHIQTCFDFLHLLSTLSFPPISIPTECLVEHLLIILFRRETQQILQYQLYHEDQLFNKLIKNK
jgi:hypothetical protein